MCSIDFDCVSSNSYKNNVDMKANEAPEKIILSADRDTQIIYDEWVIEDLTDNIKIEYTRTDVFIEKACDWLEKNGCGYWLDDSALPNRDLIEDFRKYMEK